MCHDALSTDPFSSAVADMIVKDASKDLCDAVIELAGKEGVLRRNQLLMETTRNEVARTKAEDILASVE